MVEIKAEHSIAIDGEVREDLIRHYAVDENGRINVNIPSGLAFTNVKAHYIRLRGLKWQFI